MVVHMGILTLKTIMVIPTLLMAIRMQNWIMVIHIRMAARIAPIPIHITHQARFVLNVRLSYD